MIVVGINNGITENGQELRDGAICVIKDGEIIFAEAEERFSRKKHDGGYNKSLILALEWLKINIEDVNYFGISSCIDFIEKSKSFVSDYKSVNPKKIINVGHHISHAYSTFFTSPFKSALILVIDAGGNTLSSTPGNKMWWEESREQTSYYFGDGKNIKLIGQDFSNPFEAGFGEIYRAFTHYLGWPSHLYSANTMALSGYGKAERNPFEKFKLFNFTDGILTSNFVNDPNNPIKMILESAKKQGVKLPVQLDPFTISDSGEYYGQYSDLAKHLQNELENALIKKITFLVNKYKIFNLCIAGGVGLNCVANRRILDETPIQNIFIQPAAGDDGQALGNALYVSNLTDENYKRKYSEFNPYLGREFNLSFNTISKKLSQISPNYNIKFTVCHSEKLYTEVATRLFRGQIIGWFQGRSEFGPRALGNRSILASPMLTNSFDKCHKIKTHKELYRPFAPSIIKERVKDFFVDEIVSPYMTIIGKIKSDKIAQIPAVVHVDGTARLQTVTKEINPKFYNLLKEFDDLTGVPILLNTSFNVRNEPIVDSPDDAIKCFFETDIDVLIIGELLIEKVVNFAGIEVNSKFETV